MDELMDMIGLQSIKEKVLKLYHTMKAQQSLPANRRLEQSHNFALLGNPGTGKTTVGKLLGLILHVLGVRRKDTFVRTKGEELARMGADKAALLINSAMGGVLFIDEAYALDPGRNGVDAAAVAMQLLDAAEEHRADIMIILAGYKDDMDTKLFAFNDGFSRRFNHKLEFEDYNEAECGLIFEGMCHKHDWPPSDAHTVAVAARRASRGRAKKGFGNAGAVRNLFESAYQSALGRDPDAQVLTVTDILGPRPEVNTIPELRSALDELDRMVGLDAVKTKIRQLVELSADNYDRELRGEDPFQVALNRVFLGNPGTGKTTVAKLYARILKALGYLSDGGWEVKFSSDFIGDVMGATQKKTAGILARYKGKTLVIDEAYGLHSSSYGKDAIDEIVGQVQGTPGEDRAVVLVGYAKEMQKMFRESNRGLSQRFNLDDPFVFEDFSDLDLDRILVGILRDYRMTIDVDVRNKVVQHIAAQRRFPNFGNARAVTTFVSRARERLSSRDPTATRLQLSDFELDKPVGDWRSLLTGMCKVDGIIAQFSKLEAVLKQCTSDGKDPRQQLKNYVFVGKTGTGKSTIAQAMSQMLQSLGLVNNSYKRCSALDLQGKFQGQTKDKVNEVFDETLGGVLVIDEAYTLGGSRNSFAKEAVDQLVMRSEPEEASRPVVILAGYEREMDAMLNSANAGLRNRFQGRVEFPDWDAADCLQHIRSACQREGLLLAEEAAQVLLEQLEEIRTTRSGWANARDSVNTYRRMYEARACRLAGFLETTPQFVLSDAEEAMRELRAQRPAKSNLPGNVAMDASAAMIYVAADAEFADRPMFRSEEKMSEAVKVEELCDTSAEESKVDEAVAERDDSDMNPFLAALLAACLALGYDTSHDKRQELVAILQAVQAGGGFPADILEHVTAGMGVSELVAARQLRPQVGAVLEGMHAAVAAEEVRLQEIQRLVEEQRRVEQEAEKKRLQALQQEVDERRRAEIQAEHQRLRELQRLADEQQRAVQQATHQRVQERLRQMRACPMGYSWHRCGTGWRCAGGSHYVTANQLPYE